MDLPDALFLDPLQGGLPLSDRPFAELSGRLALTEEDLLERLRALLSRGVLRRFGPIFQIEMAAPRFTLVAIAAASVPFDELAARLWALESVALLRRRQHRFETWLLLTCADTAEEDEAIARVADIARADQLIVFPRRPGPDEGGAQLSMAAEGQLLRALGSGMSMLPRPYEALAATLGITSLEVQQALQRWLSEGLVQRIGALPRQGGMSSAVALWDIEPARVAQVRERLARPPFTVAGAAPGPGPEVAAQAGCGPAAGVRWRDRRPPEWPFNLWLVVHGLTASDLAARRRQFGDALAGLARGEGDFLVAPAPVRPVAPRS